MLLHKTLSVCPDCQKEISAGIIEKDGSVFMEKACQEHGKFQIKIAKYAWYYKGITEFYNNLLPPGLIQKRNSLLYVFLTTSSCNLNCPICFTQANSTRQVPQMSLSKINEYLMKIRNQKKIIRLSGGEPTVREDLPQIISLIAKSGNYPYMFTNGLKLKDPAYLKTLKKSGLKGILMWFDSINNEKVHQQIRGQEVLKEKTCAMDNIKRQKIPFCFYHVKVKGINDLDTKGCWEYVLKNNFIKALWVKSYAHLGNKGFSRENEFLMDELTEEMVQLSNGLFNLEDMYYYQKFNCILAVLRGIPFCYYAHSIILARDATGSIKFAKFAKEIDGFEKRWQDSALIGKAYFIGSVLPKILQAFPVLGYLILRGITHREPMYKIIYDHLPKKYFLLLITSFYNSYNYDKIQIHNGCMNSVFNADPLTHTPLCQTNVKLFG